MERKRNEESLFFAWLYEILRLRLAAPNSKLSRMTINAMRSVAFHARKAHFTHTEYAITKPQVSFHSRRGRVSLPETQGFVPHNVVERYAPVGAWVKTPQPPQAVPLPLNGKARGGGGAYNKCCTRA